MDSYNAKYPLQYYEIGVPYQFYVQISSIRSGFGKIANDDDISEYSHYFNASSNSDINNDVSAYVSSSSSFLYKDIDRLVGVVVGKRRSGKTALIDVMFKITIHNRFEYRIKSYIVEYSAGLDGNEGLPPKLIGGEMKQEIVGKLTTSEKNKIGEITKVKKIIDDSTGVLTRLQGEGVLTLSNRNSSGGNSSRQSEEIIGSLTRSKK